MNRYGRFAEVYDELMKDVPYQQYIDWVKSYAPSNRYHKLLDIGCGTGSLSLKFYQEQYEVSGLDLSEEMLAVANQRFQDAGANIPLFAMSMDEMEGFHDFDVAVIPIDSINYLVDEQSIIQTFTRVYDSLRMGGQLFFDIHSLYKMDEIFLQSPFVYDDGQVTYIWYTEKGEMDHSVYHDITFFTKSDEENLFERFDEEHFQRTFPYADYVMWLKQVGFSTIEVTADWKKEEPKEKSERIFIRAVK